MYAVTAYLNASDIRATLGDFADRHDIEAIKDECAIWNGGDMVQAVSDDEFWASVERHAL